MKSHVFIKPLPLIILLLLLALFVAGCSEETGSGDQGPATAETEPPAETTASPSSGQTVPEEPTTEEPTTGEAQEQAPPPEETAGEAAASPAPSDQSTGEISALSGVEEAKRVASEWNEDAQFYSITSTQTAPVTAEGRSSGWQYSFVSPSAGEVASIEVINGQAQLANAIAQPAPTIQRITSDALPPADQLVDSTEAAEQAPQFKGYLEENPGARASAGLDAASTGEPEWFLILPETGFQERVDAAAQ